MDQSTVWPMYYYTVANSPCKCKCRVRQERKRRKERNKVHFITSPPPQRIASMRSLLCSHSTEEGQPVKVSWGSLLERIPVCHKAGQRVAPQEPRPIEIDLVQSTVVLLPVVCHLPAAGSCGERFLHAFLNIPALHVPIVGSDWWQGVGVLLHLTRRWL